MERDVQLDPVGRRARDAGIRIVDEPASQRYVAYLGGERVGFVTYRRLPDRIIFIHTETDLKVAGRGIGSLIAKHVLDEARAAGLMVTPRCPFIRTWIAQHPDYQDLLAPIP